MKLTECEVQARMTCGPVRSQVLFVNYSSTKTFKSCAMRVYCCSYCVMYYCSQLKLYILIMTWLVDLDNKTSDAEMVWNCKTWMHNVNWCCKRKLLQKKVLLQGKPPLTL